MRSPIVRRQHAAAGLGPAAGVVDDVAAPGGEQPVTPVASTRPVGSWTRALLSLLGVCEMVMAAAAGPTATVVVGVVGGAVLAATPWLLRHAPVGAFVLLLAATVPFALLTWWSLVSPLLAVVALVLGSLLIRGARPSPAGRPLLATGGAGWPGSVRHGRRR